MIAKRSTCGRARVGCVIARDNQLLISGYNGSPHLRPHAAMRHAYLMSLISLPSRSHSLLKMATERPVSR